MRSSVCVLGPVYRRGVTAVCHGDAQVNQLQPPEPLRLREFERAVVLPEAILVRCVYGTSVPAAEALASYGA